MSDVEAAIEALRAGRLAVIPTDTVYGLAADGASEDAARALYAAKGRGAAQPTALLFASVELVLERLPELAPRAAGIVRAALPGPLTLVLPRGAAVPLEVTAGGDTVAVRVPQHAVAQALLRAAAIPVAAPSANLFSRPSPTRAAHVRDDLDGRIDMILDGGPTAVGVESTVLDLTTNPPTVWRPGAVTLDMIREIVPDAIAARPAGSETSATSVSAPSASTAVRPSPSRSTARTLAPSCSSRRAMARPMPRAAPVTTAREPAAPPMPPPLSRRHDDQPVRGQSPVSSPGTVPC